MSVTMIGRDRAVCSIARFGEATEVEGDTEIKNVVDSPACVLDEEFEMAAFISVKENAGFERDSGREEPEKCITTRVNDEARGNTFGRVEVGAKEGKTFTRVAGSWDQVMDSD